MTIISVVLDSQLACDFILFLLRHCHKVVKVAVSEDMLLLYSSSTNYYVCEREKIMSTLCLSFPLVKWEK